MLPREMTILLAIAQSGGDLFNSLVRSGYLGGSKSGGYQLSSRGGQVLIEFLKKNEPRAKDTIKALQQLRIENIQEIDTLRDNRGQA